MSTDQAEQIGTGYYAVAFRLAKYPNIVFKRYTKDYGYTYYLDFLTSHHSNQYSKHYPVIYDIHLFNEFSGIVAMEQLYKVSLNIPWYRSEWEDLADGVEVIELLEHADDNIRETANAALHLGKYKETYDPYSVIPDLHSYNVMNRKDGTIVIIDPYSGGSV